jgi:hypothetical protein
MGLTSILDLTQVTIMGPKTAVIKATIIVVVVANILRFFKVF